MYPAYQMSDCSDDNLKFAVQTGVSSLVPVSFVNFVARG